MEKPCILHLPETKKELPLVLDSPHSGMHFPNDFKTLASREELLTAWDAHVEELWNGVLQFGGSLLEARFPRVIIDPNRRQNDVDPELLSEPWPIEWGVIDPSAYSVRGMGLIRRFILPGKPIYEQPLQSIEIRKRIDSFYVPYHQVLKARLDYLHLRFGRVWHIDCHSMKSKGNAMNIDAGSHRSDFVVSDMDGTSSDPDFTDWVVGELEDLGYSVSKNQPYKGGYIVQNYGRPEQGRNSIQIEINRRLYLDELCFEKSAEFSSLQQSLTVLSRRLCQKIRHELTL